MMKDKIHRIILIGVEKAFGKSQHPFMKKTFNKMEPYFNIIKAIYDNSTANIIHATKKLKAFFLRAEHGKDANSYHFYPTQY